MKLIKIGSSQACQLVLNDKHVSSLHAEITILDDGQLYIEDKNSLNGTFVNGERIDPLKQILIQRGDRVTFANVQLVWGRIPMNENLSNYKAVYNIGSNYRNDIILNNQSVSSYHASVRIGKNGKVYIHDNDSTNGTKVNGVKIEKNKDVRIKKGDNVICSTEDITSQLQQFFPSTIYKKVAIAASALAAVAAIFFAVWILLKPVGPTPQEARTAVVYLRTVFHPIVSFEDNPLPKDVWNGEVPFDDMAMISQATAFFLDKEGRLATNRHAATPWEELSADDLEKIRTHIENNLPVTNIQNIEQLDNFASNSIFGPVIFKYAINKYGATEKALNQMVNLITQLRKSKYKITGKIDHITVGYAGRYYTNTDEFQRCNVLRTSDNKEIDLAILQLNDKKTPETVKYIFNPLTCFTDKIKPLQDPLYTIGYPAGIIWGLDDNTKSLEPSIRDTKCSKEPSRYSFEFQSNSVAGNSGSPVYNKKGELVGILYGGYSVAGGATKAIHAKYLKQMYEEEVNQ